jgi:aldehyde:ferredoxin oxidoreductase
MGSKNLKAIAVRGTGKVEVADRKALAQLGRWGAEHLEESDVWGMHLDGTAGDVPFMHADGGLPTHNWDTGIFEPHEAISGQTMSDTILTDRDTCYACIVRCKRVVEIKEGPYQVDPVYGGPEYETIASVGSMCDVGSLAAIAKSNEYCNMYGIDTISTGVMMAWAMDCYDQGIITKEDTGGLDLTWGNAEAMVELTRQIGLREGFGATLADGMAVAAKKLGPEAEALAVAVKGNPLPAHMPEAKRVLALHYATNPYGADHMSVEHDPSYNDFPHRMAQLGLLDPQPIDVLNTEKVRFAAYTQRMYSALNTIGVCMFVYGTAYQLYDPTQLVQMVRAVTGWPVTLWELMKAGERSLNMMRVFNAREGFTSAQDTVPPKVMAPLQGGPTDGVRVTPEEMAAALPAYYAMNGWDEEGRPTPAKLAELGLSWLPEASA